MNCSRSAEREVMEGSEAAVCDSAELMYAPWSNEHASPMDDAAPQQNIRFATMCGPCGPLQKRVVTYTNALHCKLT